MAKANSTGAGAPSQQINAQNLPNDVSGNIERHMAGERVTTQYFGPSQRKLIHVPMDAEPPPGAVPMLGEINGGEKPTRTSTDLERDND